MVVVPRNDTKTLFNGLFFILLVFHDSYSTTLFEVQIIHLVKIQTDRQIDELEFVIDSLLDYTGWSKQCLLDWSSYIHLAVPGMIMLCVEWWTYEIGSFLAGTDHASHCYYRITRSEWGEVGLKSNSGLSSTGLISEVELDAQSVVYELANVAYMVINNEHASNCSCVFMPCNFIVMLYFVLFLVPIGY